MADSRIKSASEILSAFFDRDLVKQGEYYALFDRSWKSIAGARLAPHSRPTEIRHGVLLVETEHQGWMQLLQLQQDRMLDEIRRRFPDLGVRSLAFRLGNSDGSDRDGKGKDKTARAQYPEIPGPEPSATSTPAIDAPTEAPPSAASPSAPSSRLPEDIRDMFEKIRKNIRR